MTIPAWVGALIGIPYEQLDCVGLIQQVFAQHWGIVLPRFTVGRRGVSKAEAADIAWQEIPAGAERSGDLVALTRGRWVVHVAIIVDPPWMLHTLEGLDSTLERYDTFVYRSRIAGFYRHPELSPA